MNFELLKYKLTFLINVGDKLVSPNSLTGHMRTMLLGGKEEGGNRSRRGKGEEKAAEQSRRPCQRAELGDLGFFFLSNATSMNFTATP